MKTDWSIIKLETNRLKGHMVSKYKNSPEAFNKYIIKLETNRLKGHMVSKYQNSPEAFNKYLLSTAGKIIQDIRCSNIKGSSNNKTPKYYLSKLSHNSFSNIKCNNTYTKEIERIFNSSRLKNSHDYDEIYTKILKVSAPFVSSPLNYICNKSNIRNRSYSL
jgi:hypothetical protein